MNEKILVVDDEKEIADLIEVYLTSEGYTVWKCNNGREALKYIDEVDLDLAVLDVMLPDMDGFHICRKIREKYFFPVIMRYNNAVGFSEKPQTNAEYDMKGLIINRETHKCTLYGKEIFLTPIEFSILWYLCEHKGKVISSEELFEQVWGEKFLENNNTVMAHIGRIREKLKEPARNPKFIKTVWGVGYTIE